MVTRRAVRASSVVASPVIPSPAPAATPLSNGSLQRALLTRLRMNSGAASLQRENGSEEAPPEDAPPEETPGEAPPETAQPPAECAHDGALAWSDFQGTPPETSRYTAKTYAPVESVANGTRFQARFNGSRSWVMPEYTHDDHRLYPPVIQELANCRERFADLEPGQTAWENVGYSPTRQCPAAIVPPAQMRAESEDDCDEYERLADEAGAQETLRLLAHEQTHYDIACAVARKGNALVAAGVDFTTVRERIDSRRRGLRHLQDTFDSESTHGCVTAGQNDWATNHVAKVAAAFADLEPTSTPEEAPSEGTPPAETTPEGGSDE